MKKIILLCCVTLCFLACKTEEKKKPIEQSVEPVKVETPKELTVDFSFKTNKTDVFRIMTNNIEVDDLQKMNIQVFETVDPTTNYESIIAKFPKDIISNNVFVSLGHKEVKSVDVNSVTITYGDYSISANINTLENYFVLNKFVELDKDANVLKTKRVDGKHNPQLILRRKAINELKGVKVQKKQK